MPDFLKMGLSLMVVGMVATAILAATEAVTREPIAEAKRQEILRALRQVLPEGFDNEPDRDIVEFSDSLLNRKLKPVVFYRARKAGSDLGAAYVVTAPDGYSGNIDIMMAVAPGGTVTGIQIVAHAETPGLGDKAVITDWPDSFKGTTKDNVKWGVKKDGGDFDQFAGATITPRAIVHAVKKGLDFFLANESRIFVPAAPPAASNESP
ncbi:MAG: RnfABCDGE type electron transport complex subunit G [Magnetococcales bacterium]|nr:RnfABCDGE type electron transport complex subunit G [Magnetococcales bacterium]